MMLASGLEQKGQGRATQRGVMISTGLDRRLGSRRTHLCRILSVVKDLVLPVERELRSHQVTVCWHSPDVQ